MIGKRLQGKVALVTGSTRGIGEEIARTMAAEGAAVMVTGRSVHDGQRVVDEICRAGGTADFIELNIAQESSVNDCVHRTVVRFGGLHVLVNNAAPTEYLAGEEGGDASVTELTTERWRTITSVGLDGQFWMLRAAIPEIRKSGGGSIINISSSAAIQGRGGYDGYTAAKGALNALTRSIAVNYAADRIRCNAIVVGPVLTRAAELSLATNPTLRQAIADILLTDDLGRPDAIAAPAVFLASDEAYYITGQELVVDGGMSIRMPVPKIEV